MKTIVLKDCIEAMKDIPDFILLGEILRRREYLQNQPDGNFDSTIIIKFKKSPGIHVTSYYLSYNKEDK